MWLLFSLVWIYFSSVTDCLNYSYVMVFMENVPKRQENSNIYLFIGTAETRSCTGYVYTPLLTGRQDYVKTVFKIEGPNGSHFKFNPALKLEDTGLHNSTLVMESSHPMTVIGLNREHPSSDSFLVFSTPNLGIEYFAVSYASTSGGYCFLACEFAMVAVDDDTNIQIQLPNSDFRQQVLIGTETYTNGQTIQLRLEQYQSYQIQSKYDLTGTHVVGDKPFAMFSGNKKTNLGASSKDHLAEQLIPVMSMGRWFTVVPTPDQTITTSLLFRVIATEDKTVVRINDAEEHELERPGDWVEIRVEEDEYYTVRSNHQIMVMDFLSLGHSKKSNSGSTDPCLVSIIPTEQWLSRYIYFALNTYTNYFIVVIDNSTKGGLLLNGQPVTNVVWKQVKASTLVGGFFKVTEATNFLSNRLENVTFGAYVYGRVGVETHCTVAGIDLDPKKVEQPPESSTVSGVTQQINTSFSVINSVTTSDPESSSVQTETTSTVAFSSNLAVTVSGSSSDQTDSTSTITVSSSDQTNTTSTIAGSNHDQMDSITTVAESNSVNIVSSSVVGSSSVQTVSITESSITLEPSVSFTSDILSSSFRTSSTSSSVDVTLTSIYTSSTSPSVDVTFTTIYTSSTSPSVDVTLTSIYTSSTSSSVDVTLTSIYTSSTSSSVDVTLTSIYTSSTSPSVDVTFTTIYSSEMTVKPTLESGSVGSTSINVPFKPKSLCRCGCSKSQLNSTETEMLISSIQTELFVDKKKVSKTVRRKTSARDSRSSSTGIGLVGVVFILITLSALIVLDLPKIFRDYKAIRREEE